MEKIKQIALKAAKEAGALLRERLGNIKNIDYKSAFNIVTDVDKASEQLILSIVRSEFPEHEILAEESGATASGNPNRWLIDPLDGTTNYTHSYPFFCVSIGFESQGKMSFGVVYNPIADDLFWAEAGKGAFLNDKPMKVSKVSSVSASLLATGFPPDTKKTVANNMTEFMTLTDMSHGVRRDGAAALDLCFVASGRLDGFWEKKLAPWDIAAGSLIVTEAGGKVTNLSGQSLDMNTGHILATNRLIHEELVQVLSTVKSSDNAQTAKSHS